MVKDAETLMDFESPVAERPSQSGAEVGAGSGPAELTFERAEKSVAREQEQVPLRRPRRHGHWNRESRRLTEDTILAWADAHHAATGDWPRWASGPVRDAPFDENWRTVDAALRTGIRGLPGGLSLRRLLIEKRRVGYPLTLEQVLAWADAHHAATGNWPRYDSGKVIDAPRENWPNLNNLLRTGGRGLAGGLSLLRILTEYRGVRIRRKTKPLSIGTVLAWADAHHAATGRWPSHDSGPVRDAPYDLTWKTIAKAMRAGRRGLPKRLSLNRLLAEHRAVRAPLSLEQILAWADAHHEATGAWPKIESGPVKGAYRENWAAINTSLGQGCRGLPGGQSLRRVLAEHRDVRHRTSKPLKIEQILAWADAHHATHGRWPTLVSGPIDGVPGETWSAVDTALITGGRGLAGATTLARLLIEHRGAKAHDRPPRLTLEQVQAWADAHRAVTGRWPTATTGAVPEAPGESWGKIAQALHNGNRGLPRGLSLADLRAQGSDRQTRTDLPGLTRDQILAWADAHHEAHGCWPTRRSGPVPTAPGETWEEIATALVRGERGLRRGTSLARLLATHRGVKRLPLNLTTIQAWANDHRQATGSWPRIHSGAVAGAPPENWSAINEALKMGHRGLPGGLSLAKLLGPSTQRQRSDLTVEQVLAWAQAHHAAHGRWPGLKSGPIPGAPGESWATINYALKFGRRGLPGGLTLAKFIGRTLDPSLPWVRLPLTVEQILAWADAHHAAHGRWPTSRSGLIPGTPDEKWQTVDASLISGQRGLPRGLSLRKLLAQYRDVTPDPASKAADDCS